MSISENISDILKCLSEDITLIAVSKYKSVSEIYEAYTCGVRNFGENKVQELISKIDELPDDINWHLIGHLQRNKVKYIVGKVKLIHSLDSVRLLEEIERQYALKELTAEVLIQINIGEEESKTGILLNELDEMLSACEKCNHVKVQGLMAIIPKCTEEKCRKYFAQMKDIWSAVDKRSYKNINMKYLSMGMSDDFKIAIEEGSNMVRVGTGIFGKR